MLSGGVFAFKGAGVEQAGGKPGKTAVLYGNRPNNPLRPKNQAGAPHTSRKAGRLSPVARQAAKKQTLKPRYRPHLLR